PAQAWHQPPRRLPGEGFDWQTVLRRRDPVPALLELEERFAGRRVLITGGAGSIGRALGTLVLGFRPQRLVVLDSHEASLAGARSVVVASTDKAALASSRYGRTKRLMEQLAAVAGVPAGAVRLVNVLGSAGSASELFLRQSRAGVPLTVTDPTMVRYWMTRGH